MTRIRSSVVCVSEGKILVFKAIDPFSKREYFFLPGGKIEDGEAPGLCGERETLEETGFKVKVIPQSEIVTEYIFFWNNQDVHCRTHFFRADLVGDATKPLPVNDASYNRGALWLDLKDITEQFKYSDSILRAVQDLIVYPPAR